MDRQESVHWDVASYALGVLDHGEIERYERHLADCTICAADLEYLLPASRLLADVDPAHIRSAVVDTQLMDRLMSAVSVDRNRGRRRHRFTVVLGTALAAAAAAGVVLAGAVWLDTIPTGDDGRDTGPIASGPSADAERPDGLPDGDRISATDPDSGVEMAAVLERTDWGTQVFLEISAVTGPRECRLIVVGADGSGEVLGSWRVPEAGYGTERQPRPLLLEAPTATSPDQIDQLRLEAVDPDGTTTTLVTVPA